MIYQQGAYWRVGYAITRRVACRVEAHAWLSSASAGRSARAAATAAATMTSLLMSRSRRRVYLPTVFGRYRRPAAAHARRLPTLGY